MSRHRAKLHLFHGKPMTMVEISKITGFSVPMLKMRARRGIPLDRPVRPPKAKKVRESKLRLTGDWDRDLKEIITARHRDVIRRHQQDMARIIGIGSGRRSP
jgi:hypothetical protein